MVAKMAAWTGDQRAAQSDVQLADRSVALSAFATAVSLDAQKAGHWAGSTVATRAFPLVGRRVDRTAERWGESKVGDSAVNSGTRMAATKAAQKVSQMAALRAAPTVCHWADRSGGY